MESDIADRARQLAQLALHDAESGLPNRLGLEQALIDMLLNARAPVVFAALAIADKGLIGQAGARLARLETDWVIGRLAPDALGIAIQSSDLALGRSRIAAAQAGLAGQSITTTAGLAAFPEQGTEALSLMARAEVALDQARGARSGLAAYDKAAHGAGDAALMADMIAGLSRGELSLLHQPKLDVRTGAISGVEALVRWTSDARGPVSPDVFVPIAEETGAIRALTDWTLTQAVSDSRAMKAAGHDLLVSVNISARLLGDSDFAAAVKHGADARLCFEITETAVMENPTLAAWIIADFARAGVEISIDDFGARMASFDYLQTIPADELKIDKSFVDAMQAGARGVFLMRSTIELAHALGLKVTVEGVESRAALDQLIALGADLIQGNFIAPPLRLEALLTYLDRANAR